MVNSNNILITGGTGLVGKHLQKFLPDGIYLSSSDADLINYEETRDVLRYYHPDRVIHLAARVGGIEDNMNYPVEYLETNLIIDTNVLKASYEQGVQRLTACLSSCIFPDVADRYPMTEDDIFKGKAPITNFAYAMAKRILLTRIESYNKQYELSWNWLAPCNLYGEYDKFEDHHSHFIPALLKKIYYAEDKITLFNMGKQYRQFMYADDLAKVFRFVIDNNIIESFNVAPNFTFTIKDMAKMALKVCAKEHLKIEWNINKPGGQFRKDISSEKFLKLYPNFEFTSMEDGMKKTYEKLDDIFGGG
tara:strand:+ start:2089 stop:3003 length:915 start_codon:yes stop_codon:yes gene_type:complete